MFDLDTAGYRYSKRKHYLTLYHTLPTFNDPTAKKALENTVGKGKNSGDQHFLLQMLLTWSSPKFCRLVKG